MKHFFYLILVTTSLLTILYVLEPIERDIPVKAVVSGLISNPIGDTIEIYNRNSSFVTTLNHNNKFHLSIDLDSANYYTFFHGTETTSMYIKPNDHISLQLDADKFDETIKYSNSETSSFLAKKYIINENLYDDFDDLFFYLSEPDFEKFCNNFKEKMYPLLENISDSLFYKKEKENFDSTLNWYNQARIERKLLPKKGEKWIDFTYPNIDGDSISLSNFKGKYVYVDIWATWCAPCINEIPYFISLKHDYSNSDIVFLSLALESESTFKWVNMVKNKDCIERVNCMVGIQLVSTDNFASQICDDYAIRMIPRFMLFDKNGTIINIEAPRPSSQEIRDIFNLLL